MLHKYLGSAIDDLHALLAITAQDIEDIQEAKHDDIFSRTKTKDDLINSFENKKNLIDSEILKLTQIYPQTPLPELLDERASELLGELRAALENLKEQNRRYARIALAVSEFYNSLLERFLPSQPHDYSGKKLVASSLLTIEV